MQQCVTWLGWGPGGEKKKKKKKRYGMSPRSRVSNTSSSVRIIRGIGHESTKSPGVTSYAPQILFLCVLKKKCTTFGSLERLSRKATNYSSPHVAPGLHTMAVIKAFPNKDAVPETSILQPAACSIPPRSLRTCRRGHRRSSKPSMPTAGAVAAERVASRIRRWDQGVVFIRWEEARCGRCRTTRCRWIAAVPKKDLEVSNGEMGGFDPPSGEPLGGFQLPPRSPQQPGSSVYAAE